MGAKISLKILVFSLALLSIFTFQHCQTVYLDSYGSNYSNKKNDRQPYKDISRRKRVNQVLSLTEVQVNNTIQPVDPSRQSFHCIAYIKNIRKTISVQMNEKESSRDTLYFDGVLVDIDGRNKDTVSFLIPLSILHNFELSRKNNNMILSSYIEKLDIRNDSLKSNNYEKKEIAEFKSFYQHSIANDNVISYFGSLYNQNIGYCEFVALNDPFLALLATVVVVGTISYVAYSYGRYSKDKENCLKNLKCDGKQKPKLLSDGILNFHCMCI